MTTEKFNNNDNDNDNDIGSDTLGLHYIQPYIHAYMHIYMHTYARTGTTGWVSTDLGPRMWDLEKHRRILRSIIDGSTM
jgi:hypothetical protein